MKTTVLAAVLASFAIAAPAFAKDHGNGKGKGHEKQEERAEGREEPRPGAFFQEQHRDAAHRYYVEHYGDGKRCPPGLAKKHNGCQPPGQARKWAVGEPIPRGVPAVAVPRPVLATLPPPPPGCRYQLMGTDIVLVRNTGNIVIDIMLNVFS